MIPFQNKMAASILIFFLATCILLVSSDVCESWWQNFLLDLGSGLYAALVLIFLYDRVIESQVQEEKRERNRIACMKLVGPLRGLIIGTMVPIYRSATLSLPVDDVVTMQRFLTEFFPCEISNLDISIRSPGSFPDIYPYPKFFSDFFKVFHNKLDEWLDQNGAIADNDLIEVVEALKIDRFMVLCLNLEASMNTVPPNFPRDFSSVKAFVFPDTTAREFCTLLARLVDLIEQKTDSKIGGFQNEYWHNECLEVGYARRVRTEPVIFPKSPVS
jgi:hypothetical protein